MTPFRVFWDYYSGSGEQHLMSSKSTLLSIHITSNISENIRIHFFEEKITNCNHGLHGMAKWDTRIAFDCLLFALSFENVSPIWRCPEILTKLLSLISWLFSHYNYVYVALKHWQNYLRVTLNNLPFKVSSYLKIVTPGKGNNGWMEQNSRSAFRC